LVLWSGFWFNLIGLFMPTRLKRPSIAKQLGLSVLLLGLLGYLGFSAVSGQYGMVGRWQLQEEMVVLNAQSARLKAEIESYRHRIALFDPERLDPDILSERALALLTMVHRDDRLIILGPDSEL
jgi:cell division protein FtsB